MPNIRRFVSDEDELERFSAQLDREMDRVKNAVAMVEAKPLCNIAFLYVWEDDAQFSYAYAWTQAARAGVRVDRWEEAAPIWQPADWDVELDPASPDEASRAEAPRLGALIRETGYDRAARPFLRDLCINLNALNWGSIVETTEDFVTWPNDHELSDLSAPSFKAIAPPRIYEAYAERGWTRWLDEYSFTDQPPA